MKKGYFLIEAILSVVIFSLLILSIFSMISFLQRRIVRSGFENDATLVLQDGIEIAHSVLKQDWSAYPDGRYYPVFNADTKSWMLASGTESGVEARYDRYIDLRKICRDRVTGERLAYGTACGGVIDKHSREISASVTWLEAGSSKSIGATLLVLNINE